MNAPDQNVIDAIVANNRAFEEAFGMLDAEALAAAYTSNGMLMPPNSPIITGRANMVSFWQGISAHACLFRVLLSAQH